MCVCVWGGGHAWVIGCISVVNCPHITIFIVSPAAPIGRAVYRMLVIQAFRADRLLAIASHLVIAVFGEVFQQHSEQEMDLANIVATEVCACVCVCVCIVGIAGKQSLNFLHLV